MLSGGVCPFMYFSYASHELHLSLKQGVTSHSIWQGPNYDDAATETLVPSPVHDLGIRKIKPLTVGSLPRADKHNKPLTVGPLLRNTLAAS